MMYVQFMKNFLLADSSELMAFGVISASRAQKTLDSYFSRQGVRRVHENYLLAIRASYCLLDSFWSPEPKNI